MLRIAMCMLMLAPAAVWADDHESEEMERRIRSLEEAAERAQDEQDEARAEELHARAEEARRVYEEVMERREVREGIGAGAEALERLGYKEEAAKMRVLLWKLEQRFDERRTKALVLALEVLEGVEGQQVADMRNLLERARKALDVRWEAAGPNAMKAMRERPDQADVIKVLFAVSKFCEKQGKKDAAEYLHLEGKRWRMELTPAGRARSGTHPLEIAKGALKRSESERDRAILEHYEELLERRGDERGWSPRERGAVIEILGHTMRLLDAAGREADEERVGRYREELIDLHRGRHEHDDEEEEHEHDGDELEELLERVEGAYEEMEERLERLERRLERMSERTERALNRIIDALEQLEEEIDEMEDAVGGEEK